jgi:hypothetical protein
VLYSTCASKRAGVNKTVCVTSMSEFIKVKSYARFRRLLPTRQAKSFARSYIARHLEMLATFRMRVPTLHASKTEARKGRQRASGKPDVTCALSSSCVSLCPFSSQACSMVSVTACQKTLVSALVARVADSTCFDEHP